MSTDVTVTHDGERLSARVTGDTDAGVEFVDGWYPAGQDVVGFRVIDSGDIVVHFNDAGTLVAAAREAGLSVNVVEGDR